MHTCYRGFCLEHCLFFFPQKRLLASESVERLSEKRQRLAEQRSQKLAENGLLSRNAISPSFNPTSSSTTEFPQADALISIHNAQNCFSCNTQSVSKGRSQETKMQPQNDPNCPQQLFITTLHKQKKYKKHKDEERDWLSDDQGNRWMEASKHKPRKPDSE